MALGATSGGGATWDDGAGVAGADAAGVDVGAVCAAVTSGSSARGGQYDGFSTLKFLDAICTPFGLYMRRRNVQIGLFRTNRRTSCWIQRSTAPHSRRVCGSTPLFAWAASASPLRAVASVGSLARAAVRSTVGQVVYARGLNLDVIT